MKKDFYGYCMFCAEELTEENVVMLSNIVDENHRMHGQRVCTECFDDIFGGLDDVARRVE